MFIPLVFVSLSESMLVSEVVSSSVFFLFFVLCLLFFHRIFERFKNDNAFDCTCICAILSLLVPPPLLFETFCFYFLTLCVSVWMCVRASQCLQRTWKRASGRWRGSCCSSRRTWRLSPPPMAPMTCFSPKWSYPFHIYAFAHCSGAAYGEFIVSEQRNLSDTRFRLDHLQT